ncbi:transcriptional repressor, CtsR [Ammonifex degensii KC4]|uniref:Transcriptional repressor, CtsR n=2 Tax=Ammonifex degensii TaxID=42838 RepID=C9R9Q1_AMMDK|nr:transcriptional repressor, CtsR [Ammonifex degensii KC4]
MRSLADEIEAYLRQLLAQSPTGQVVVRRSALANQFGCTPAQINYVLSTRFTAWHGFWVESRRGGGGFLRISRLCSPDYRELLRKFLQALEGGIGEGEAVGFLTRLREEGILSNREACLVQRMLTQGLAGLPPTWRPRLRASLLRALLTAVLGSQD